METMIQPPHPAIRRYLVALEASVQRTPGIARGPALADALEFLLSEWESVRRRQPECAEDALYQHFVRKFGAPGEVAAGYAESVEPALAACAVIRPRPVKRPLLTALTVLCAIVLFVLLTRSVALRTASASAGQETISAAPGTAIQLNLETMACAGRIVSSRRGLPERSPSADPRFALGMPDFRHAEKEYRTFFNLGRGGELTVEFLDRWLCDGPGADLAIFEVGHDESVEVAVSADGTTWHELGCTAGGLGTLDLAAAGLKKQRFRFVRLIDSQRQVTRKPAYWGADIDAIVAIHTKNTP